MQIPSHLPIASAGPAKTFRKHQAEPADRYTLGQPGPLTKERLKVQIPNIVLHGLLLSGAALAGGLVLTIGAPIVLFAALGQGLRSDDYHMQEQKFPGHAIFPADDPKNLTGLGRLLRMGEVPILTALLAGVAAHIEDNLSPPPTPKPGPLGGPKRAFDKGPQGPEPKEAVQQLVSDPKTHGIEQGMGYVRVGTTKIKTRRARS